VEACGGRDVILPHVIYSLTPLGETISDPLVAICRCAMDHLHEMQEARARSQATAVA
jgi:DNA-binding HxlR family transcriptional regulator